MEMNDFSFPKWLLCDSCAHGRGRDFGETTRYLRQLRSAIHGWETLAPGRWCRQAAGTGGCHPFRLCLEGEAPRQGDELQWLLCRFAPVGDEARLLCRSCSENFPFPNLWTYCSSLAPTPGEKGCPCSCPTPAATKRRMC